MELTRPTIEFVQDPAEGKRHWTLMVDGSSTTNGCGAEIIFQSPELQKGTNLNMQSDFSSRLQTMKRNMKPFYTTRIRHFTNGNLPTALISVGIVKITDRLNDDQYLPTAHRKYRPSSGR